MNEKEYMESIKDQYKEHLIRNPILRQVFGLVANSGLSQEEALLVAIVELCKANNNLTEALVNCHQNSTVSFAIIGKESLKGN